MGEDKQLLKVIGKGSFGTVYLSKSIDTHRLHAIKKVPKIDDESNNFEKKIAEVLPPHPNIVGYLGSYEDEQFTYLSFQYVEGMDLFTYMESRHFTPLSEKRAHKLFSQLFRAISHLHTNNVVHLDIKLENLMLNGKGNLVVIDFGRSLVVPSEDHLITEYSGSMDYVSAEIITQKPYSGSKADLYACGVILYTLLFAGFPYTQEERYQLLVDENAHQPLQFPLDASSDVKDLLSRLLANDPSKRMSVKELSKHKWMRKKLWWF